MDPTKQFLQDPPRNREEDAFFESDRSPTAVIRTPTVCVGAGPFNRDVGSCPSPATLSIVGWLNRFAISRFSAENPLPAKQLDPTFTNWVQDVTYVSLASESAKSVLAPGSTARLRVSILFTTLGGVSSYRHGICTWFGGATEPVLLILVEGVDLKTTVQLRDPVSGSTKTVSADNFWGVGITEHIIKQSIAKCLGAPATAIIPYDVVIVACYSTGHYGLTGSVERGFFSFAKLERAIIFDCLYVTLGPQLTYLKKLRPSLQIIAYVVTGSKKGGGNSFKGDPSFANLALGNIPGWNYINLFFDIRYSAVASARVIAEGVSPGNPIITILPSALKTALPDMTRSLPPRGNMISSAAVFSRVKGSMPSGATTLDNCANTNHDQIVAFCRGSAVTARRQCLGNAQLLGWPTPDGEEWHDLLLIEFAWEYLL